jgi:hypothetical protein
MFRMTRRCQPLIIRTLALGLLLLSLVVQPLLASMGEIHELGHAEGAEVAHAVELESHEDAAGDETQSPAHVLLHFAHCCGHPSVVAVSLIPMVAASWPERFVASADASALPRSFTGSPFRPPIAM